MTTLEYFETPESLLPTELAFGTLLVRDSPSSSHQAAVGSFFVALRAHVRAQALGVVWIAPLDVVLDEGNALVVQPDLLYVSQPRADIVRRRVFGPPDLVVEVLSPRPGRRLREAARVVCHVRRRGMLGVSSDSPAPRDHPVHRGSRGSPDDAWAGRACSV